MNDSIRELRNAEHMVLRILIGSLWEELLLSREDPLSELKSVSAGQLHALDRLTEKEGGNPIFNHAALHELETFWTGVRRTVEAVVELRSASTTKLSLVPTAATFD